MAKEVPDRATVSLPDAPSLPDTDDAAPDDGDDDSLRCGACGHAITARRDRIAMSGAHAHTFVNPSGLAFHIGCFATATGCVHVGDEDAAFSWFPGWTWQIATCARCRAHLGWKFRLAADAFWGLILDRLRDPG